MNTIAEMPDDARIWIYQCNRILSTQEIESINAMGTTFIEQWTAHGKSMRAAIEWRHNRFLVLAADEHAAEASGCSIDKSVAFIMGLEKQFDIRLLDRLTIAYRNENNDIQTAPFQEVKARIKEGVLSRDTIIFNNMVSTKKDLDEAWEIALGNSWLMHS